MLILFLCLVFAISLIPLLLHLWVFFWAVSNGQFDDPERSAHQILWDNEDLAPAIDPDRHDDGCVTSNKGMAGDERAADP